MDETGDRKDYTVPSYASDEKTKDGFVRVIVGTKGLKFSRKLKGLKLVKTAENANVDLQFPNESSFCLTVEGGQKTSLKGKCFQLKIKRLPHEIITNKSYFEVDEDRVLVFLSKKQDKSWYPEMESGLEMDEEED